MHGRSITSRALALGASGVLVVAAFAPWTSGGRVAVDLRLWDALPVSLGLVVIAIAALPALGAVLSGRGVTQLLGAVMTGTLVLVWLATGVAASLSGGVLLAMAATVVWLHGAAVARR